MDSFIALPIMGGITVVYEFDNGWKVTVCRTYSFDMWAVYVRNQNGSMVDKDVIFKADLEDLLKEIESHE